MLLLWVENSIRTILECIGEDPDREGLRLTPKRYAKAMIDFTKGYDQNIRDIIGGAVFKEDHDEMGNALSPTTHPHVLIYSLQLLSRISRSTHSASTTLSHFSAKCTLGTYQTAKY